MNVLNVYGAEPLSVKSNSKYESDQKSAPMYMIF